MTGSCTYELLTSFSQSPPRESGKPTRNRGIATATEMEDSSKDDRRHLVPR